ncbi:hypothetical protein LTR56_010042 [Elasticomyces elasticus]|nr:hypothetical protein LTR56_010042 [Elasticomyces elasticus]KAK3665013.1 hypothetical protein LTR22_004066 [Elasticomyces elasticus]KAK4931611.1 hypothetical protein LTR49_002002 [Elasticomyces elasticus]KAK5766770.1 hypothetical protein LTS12_003122 [Elasticomyces elasticus]
MVARSTIYNGYQAPPRPPPGRSQPLPTLINAPPLNYNPALILQTRFIIWPLDDQRLAELMPYINEGSNVQALTAERPSRSPLYAASASRQGQTADKTALLSPSQLRMIHFRGFSRDGVKPRPEYVDYASGVYELGGLVFRGSDFGGEIQDFVICNMSKCNHCRATLTSKSIWSTFSNTTEIK